MCGVQPGPPYVPDPRHSWQHMSNCPHSKATFTKETNEMGNMEVDMRKHELIRQQVHAGLAALRVQARQIWGERDYSNDLHGIVVRLMVGVGDLSRLARDRSLVLDRGCPVDVEGREIARRELKKELGNIIFSTIRWVDDLGLDVLECLDLAIEAQEKFAKSGRPR